MPLVKSKSPKAFKQNIRAEVKAGKPVKQAVAIAYDVQRRAKKMAVGGSPNSPMAGIRKPALVQRPNLTPEQQSAAKSLEKTNKAAFEALQPLKSQYGPGGVGKSPERMNYERYLGTERQRMAAVSDKGRLGTGTVSAYTPIKYDPTKTYAKGGKAKKGGCSW